MEYILPLFALAAVILTVNFFLPDRAKKGTATVHSKPLYQYSRKAEFITPSEKEFFKILSEVAADRYYIFPQIHLSSLFKNETKGRYYKLAFQIINRRSVDYVLCDKTTLEPVYAVELDDSTHNRPGVIKRDSEVDQLFAEHNLPLVRFSNYRSLTQDDIAKRFFEAHSSQPAN